MSYIALTRIEINWCVAHLFDKDPPTPQPASMPTPFSSENLPSKVRVSFLSDILYLHCLITLFCL
jgi:hypothetical protein